MSMAKDEEDEKDEKKGSLDQIPQLCGLTISHAVSSFTCMRR